MSTIHKTVISVLLALALIFFIIACWVPFAVTDYFDEAAQSQSTSYSLTDMTMTQLTVVSALTLGGFLSFSLPAALILCALAALTLFFSDKLRKFSILCALLFAIFTFFSLLLLCASYDWFGSVPDSPYDYYVPAAGFVLMLLSLLFVAASLSYYAIYLIVKYVSAEDDDENPYDDLFKLKQLLDNGAISQYEFDAKKREILTGKKMTKEEKERLEKMSSLEKLHKANIISQEEFDNETKSL